MESRSSTSNPSRSAPPFRTGVLTRAQARAVREAEAQQVVVALVKMAVARARYGAELKAERKAVLYEQMQVSLGIMCEYFFSGPVRAGGLEMEEASRLFRTSRNPPCSRGMLKRAVDQRSKYEAQAFFDRFVLYYDLMTRLQEIDVDYPPERLVRLNENTVYRVYGELVEMHEYPADFRVRYDEYIDQDVIESKITLDKARGVVKFFYPARYINFDIRFSPLPSGLRRRCIFEGTLVGALRGGVDHDLGLISRFRLQRAYPHSLIRALIEWSDGYLAPRYNNCILTCFDGEQQVPCMNVTVRTNDPNPNWVILESTGHNEYDPLNLCGSGIESRGPLNINRLQQVVDSLFPGEFHLVADGDADGDVGGGAAGAPVGAGDADGN